MPLGSMQLIQVWSCCTFAQLALPIETVTDTVGAPKDSPRR